MTSTVIYFLFALATGGGDSVNLNAIGAFSDAQTCAGAKARIETALQAGKASAQFVCIQSDKLAEIGRSGN